MGVAKPRAGTAFAAGHRVCAIFLFVLDGASSRFNQCSGLNSRPESFSNSRYVRTQFDQMFLFMSSCHDMISPEFVENHTMAVGPSSQTCKPTVWLHRARVTRVPRLGLRRAHEPMRKVAHHGRVRVRRFSI